VVDDNAEIRRLITNLYYQALSLGECDSLNFSQYILATIK